MLGQLAAQSLEFGWAVCKRDKHESPFLGGEVQDAGPQGVGSHELARQRGVGKCLGNLEDDPVLDSDAGDDHAAD